MRRLKLGRVPLLLLAGLALPAAALAQRPGLGNLGRGRTPGRLARDQGIEIPKVLNPINLMIMHRQELALTDTQFVRIIAIKRALDSTNAPLMRQLDSVGHVLKSAPIFSEPSRQRRDSLAAGRQLVAEVVADVNDNIADARDKAIALLSQSQRTSIDQIEEKEREANAASSRGKP
jgi:hypothetical protein